MFEINATKNDHSRTLFKVVQKYLNNLPISRIERIFRKKDIKVNNVRNVSKDYKIKEGDYIVIYGVSDAQKEIQYAPLYNELSIVYEDQNLLIINKKPGISVHGEENSLDNQVLAYLKYKKSDSFIPGHIGRIDKETSGLMVYGKNYQTVKMLNEKTQYFVKKYQFYSDFVPNNQKVSLYFYKDQKSQKQKVSKNYVEGSKEGTTLFTMDGNKKIAQILSGRKHQIRLTLKYLNCPIYGDRKYGGKKASRLMLHAWYLKLSHLDNELAYLNKMEFWAPIKW